MRKLLIPIVFLCAFIGTTNHANGQALAIDSPTVNIFGLPDTIVINDNYNHSVIVTNQSATPLTGTIYLMAAVDTGTGIVGVDTVGFSNVTGFGLWDTVGFNYSETYSFPNDYRLGGNIVVVWPVAANASTVDSLFVPVWILNQTGVSELELQQGTTVYPNPFKDQIWLNSPNKNSIKQVRLIDLRGRVVWDSPFTPVIDMRSMASGMFLLEIIYFDNQREHLKILKE